VAPSDRPAVTNSAPATLANAPGEQLRAVVRNGYTYQIDSRGRTRRVSGALAIADVPVRSRTSQSWAGGEERRATDDGGHYIAARFNGPTEAFNHFAQDANFNRGRYRVLEEEWARNKRAGKAVTVRIVPRFDGETLRPSVIDVWWTVDGKGRSAKFPNERSERKRGK
ncbi:MAG: DNA/RNA non-specific endonuclease, partial [Sphingomonas sp.]